MKTFRAHGLPIVGVAYQLTQDDPLVNADQCKLDASLMKDLGANTIRVYHVDANGDHKGCMDAFAENGIYLFVDLDTFSTQINRVRTSRATKRDSIADLQMHRTIHSGIRPN